MITELLDSNEYDSYYTNYINTATDKDIVKG